MFSFPDGFGTACSRLKFSFKYPACTDLCVQGLKCNHGAVFTRLNATAFIKFLVSPMRRLLNGGVYFDIADNSYCKSFINVV